MQSAPIWIQLSPKWLDFKKIYIQKPFSKPSFFLKFKKDHKLIFLIKSKYQKINSIFDPIFAHQNFF